MFFLRIISTESRRKRSPPWAGAAAPFQFYLLNVPHEVTAGTVRMPTVLTEDVMLDIKCAGNVDEAYKLVFEYTRFGEITPVSGVFHGFFCPEPATTVLLVAGGLLVLPRRCRCA